MQSKYIGSIPIFSTITGKFAQRQCAGFATRLIKWAFLNEYWESLVIRMFWEHETEGSNPSYSTNGCMFWALSSVW